MVFQFWGRSATSINLACYPNFFEIILGIWIRLFLSNWIQGHDGRVVKALDSKSNGIFPHRFESCSWREIFWTSNMSSSKTSRLLTISWIAAQSFQSLKITYVDNSGFELVCFAQCRWRCLHFHYSCWKTINIYLLDLLQLLSFLSRHIGEWTSMVLNTFEVWRSSKLYVKFLRRKTKYEQRLIMEEVLAIWNSTSSEVKKYIPKVTWDSSKVLLDSM